LLLSYQIVVRPLPATTYTTSSRANLRGRVLSPAGISGVGVALTPSQPHHRVKGGRDITPFPQASFTGREHAGEKTGGDRQGGGFHPVIVGKLFAPHGPFRFECSLCHR